MNAFFFFCVSPRFAAWSECAIVSASELPHKLFICHFTFRGHFLFISEWSRARQRNHVNVDVFHAFGNSISDLFGLFSEVKTP